MSHSLNSKPSPDPYPDANPPSDLEIVGSLSRRTLTMLSHARRSSLQPGGDQGSIQGSVTASGVAQSSYMGQDAGSGMAPAGSYALTTADLDEAMLTTFDDDREQITKSITGLLRAHGSITCAAMLTT